MELEKQPTLDLSFEDWGLVDYNEAQARQLLILQKIDESDADGTVVFCSHPPVVTLGRAAQASDLVGWQGPLIEVSRGGRATYHGPSQLVIYPIINLKHAGSQRPAKDIGAFLRNFEQALVETLSVYGIQAQGRSLQKREGLEEDATGVWVGSQKIASLGIAVRRWITYHGAAINIDFDPQAFQGLRPCGFQASVMTSLEKLLGRTVDRQQFKEILRSQLLERL